jgi:hypothetical protein
MAPLGLTAGKDSRKIKVTLPARVVRACRLSAKQVPNQGEQVSLSPSFAKEFYL